MASLDDERTAFWQLRARRQRLGEIVGHVRETEPIVQDCAQARIVDADQRQQRPQARRCSGRCTGHRRRIEGQLGGRRIGCKGLDPIQIGHFECGQTLTQHRFQSRFPTRLDVQLLPQTRQAIQLMLFQPRLDLAFGLDVFLQLLERGKACI